ncbi:3-mercaptopyruvate sulfurtransferase [Paenibacillus darwinianus]|uniref:3-mercaptopyruvate sulfurtransferase n=1 Tax=Paenibacillus darwinianus TaxID=1380763 RepID=A0A9W5RYK7_9BACL|nr:sulfurtransferase [Paenibacillus darwinianus]EXX85324.1 3-mercaptopyruvate sulfurtransferase [Paenibacillus darwinianus]EXX86188.1 3-mercaptopyruvate sulfurtransferase [Paenibacillus darwinianus]EXX86514.1 3-mercaptopyruvate sulfurtransferase [Paenibacillus darwinianus]
MKGTVTTEWLAARLGEAGFAVVDCRFALNDPAAGRQAYLAVHIPGAYYADLEQDLSGPKRPGGAGGRHPLPDAGKLAVALSRMGIGNETTVVAYDDQGGAMASRLCWLLRYTGHTGEAYILDGGFGEWSAEARPVTAEVPAQAEGVSYEVRIRPELAVDQADVRVLIGKPGAVLIDSREAFRYSGESEPIDPVAGHIPGAINRFWKYGLDESGHWKSAEAQLERFADLPKDAEIIVYCGSGVTACPNVFALEAAGFRNVKLYAGSWSDWVSNMENPVATGDEEEA